MLFSDDVFYSLSNIYESGWISASFDVSRQCEAGIIL